MVTKGYLLINAPVDPRSVLKILEGFSPLHSPKHIKTTLLCLCVSGEGGGERERAPMKCQLVTLHLRKELAPRG